MVDEHLLGIDGGENGIEAGRDHVEVDGGGFDGRVGADAGGDAVDDVAIGIAKQGQRNKRQSDGDGHGGGVGAHGG